MGGPGGKQTGLGGLLASLKHRLPIKFGKMTRLYRCQERWSPGPVLSFNPWQCSRMPCSTSWARHDHIGPCCSDLITYQTAPDYCSHRQSTRHIQYSYNTIHIPLPFPWRGQPLLSNDDQSQRANKQHPLLRFFLEMTWSVFSSRITGFCFAKRGDVSFSFHPPMPSSSHTEWGAGKGSYAMTHSPEFT